MPQAERLLDMQAFKEAASIGRTTVFAWMAEGKLKEGRDFVNLSKSTKRRMLRFLYPQCIKTLVEAAQPQKIEKKPPRSKPRSKSAAGVNLAWSPE